jgi:ABC-2 type transport system ATP-binding protein
VVARGRVVAQGTLLEIRDLLADYPLSVRIDSERPRELAGALLQLPETLGVELDGGPTVVVRARHPQRFFRALGRLVLEEAFDIRHLETLDSSAQAILEYLLRDGR